MFCHEIFPVVLSKSRSRSTYKKKKKTPTSCLLSHSSASANISNPHCLRPAVSYDEDLIENISLGENVILSIRTSSLTYLFSVDILMQSL